MRKMIFLCRRRPDIDHATYANHLLDRHVPLALKHHPAMQHYRVNIVDEKRIARSANLDSIGELFFASVEDYQTRLYDSGQGRRPYKRIPPPFWVARMRTSAPRKYRWIRAFHARSERVPWV